MRHEMSDVQRFLNQNKELHNTAQTMELFTDKFLAFSATGCTQDQESWVGCT